MHDIQYVFHVHCEICMLSSLLVPFPVFTRDFKNTDKQGWQNTSLAHSSRFHWPALWVIVSWDGRLYRVQCPAWVAVAKPSPTVHSLAPSPSLTLIQTTYFQHNLASLKDHCRQKDQFIIRPLFLIYLEN